LDDAQVQAQVREQLEAFRRALDALDLAPPSAERDLLALLLNQDRLIDTVASQQWEQPSRVGDTLRSMGLDEDDLTRDEQRLLLRLARNELWLSGYLRSDILNPVTRKEMKEALALYWKSLPGILTEDVLKQRVQSLSFEFFEDMARQQTQPELSREDLTRFVKDNEKELQSNWASYVGNSDFFIWDGLKHAFRWLKRQVKRLSEPLLELARWAKEFAATLVRNVFRTLFQSANEVLTDVKHAIRAFVDGMGMYLSGEVRSKGSVLSAACQLSPDGDMALFIDGGPDALMKTECMVERMRRMGAALSLASSIIVLVVRLVASAAKGVYGWITLIAHLVKVAPQILAQIRELALLGAS
jgi:hypothetical protein